MISPVKALTIAALACGFAGSALAQSHAMTAQRSGIASNTPSAVSDSGTTFSSSGGSSDPNASPANQTNRGPTYPNMARSGISNNAPPAVNDGGTTFSSSGGSTDPNASPANRPNPPANMGRSSAYSPDPAYRPN